MTDTTKSPGKLPLNRNKPVGRSISPSDVAKMVQAAQARGAAQDAPKPGPVSQSPRTKKRPQRPV
jgi:hypothetical protein